jgi:hypothetical protein
MGEHERSDARGPAAPATPRVRDGAAPATRSGAPVRSPAPAPAQALALQRAAGNRAVTRALSRWAAHPDPEKKGVLMADETAAAFVRFNPPLSK